MHTEYDVLSLIQRLTPYRGLVLAFFVGLPVLTWGLGRLLKRHAQRETCARFLSIPIHLAALPGMLMSLLVAYGLFFSRSNLLNGYDVVFFFLPILSMVLTYLAARDILPIKEIPGTGRLVGWMLLAGLVFTVLLILDRMFFGILFLASSGMLLVAVALLFLLYKFAMWKVSRKPKEPGMGNEPPSKKASPSPSRPGPGSTDAVPNRRDTRASEEEFEQLLGL
jgi:amino acid transporter